MEGERPRARSRAASEVVNRFPDDAREYRRVRRLVLRDITVCDDKLAEVLPLCPRLESLVLHGVPSLTDRTVLLAAAAHNLQSLDLSGCKNITDDGILGLEDKFTSLRVLCLNGVANLTDRSVSAIAKSCSNLEVLELSSLLLLTAVSIRDVWSHSRKLRVLKLAYCPLLTDRAFPASPRGAGNVESSTTNRPSIQQPLAWQESLPPLILTHIADKLRILDIAHCTTLTDDGVGGIVWHAPKLQTLVISSCTALTDGAIDTISRLGGSLEKLMLAHVANVTDRAIIKLARSCSNLVSVDVAFCRHLTDMAIFELAGLPSLRRLSLVRVHKLTDIAIDALADQARALESLDISYCDNLSLGPVYLLLKRCGTLRYLNATGVPSFRRKGVKRFSDSPPSEWGIDQKAAFRVFNGDNVVALRQFLEKESQRRREAESQNIKFVPRADDKLDLY